MFKMLNKLFGIKPDPVNPQITDSVTQNMQAAVTEKIKAPAKPKKPRTKKQ